VVVISTAFLGVEVILTGDLVGEVKGRLVDKGVLGVVVTLSLEIETDIEVDVWTETDSGSFLIKSLLSSSETSSPSSSSLSRVPMLKELLKDLTG